MIKKTFTLLFVGFLFQLMFSCDYDCNRPKPTVYLKYTELMLSTSVYNPSTENSTPIQDSILKQNFRITISMQQEETKQVAKSAIPIFGFQPANAIDCGPPMVYQDLISQINITMIDINNELPHKEVSTLFGYQSSDSTEVTYIHEYLADQTKFQPRDYFRLSCITPDSLYKKAQFRVEAILESGIVFTQDTDTILFKE